jgi:hypothetical protein
MQNPITLRPPRSSYLLFLAGFVVIFDVLSFLLNIAIYKSDPQAFRLTDGEIIGSLVGALILWGYDELTGFKRIALVIEEYSIKIPAGFSDDKYLTSEWVDKPRTLVYNAKTRLLNRILYTFWLVNGKRININRLLVGSSQLKLLLEKLDCL